MDFIGADEQLFTPLKLGQMNLRHRVIMAPLTHYDAQDHIPGKAVADYYAERASNGGMIITEATHVSERAGNSPKSPRIDISEAVEGWRRVVSAVHKKGGYMVLHLNHVGRCALPKYMSQQLPLSSTSTPLSRGATIGDFTEGPAPKDLEHIKPKQMDFNDFYAVRNEFVTAAKSAIEIAKFDAVEINAGSGHLLEQYFADNVNKREDEYGGPEIQRRARFPLWLIRQVCQAIGADRVGVRLTPHSRVNDIADSQPIDNWKYIFKQLDSMGLAYIHLLEPSVFALQGLPRPLHSDSSDSYDHGRCREATIEPFLQVVENTPVISAGGWDDDNCRGVVTPTSKVVALAFGRYFASNPDLPKRLKYGIPLKEYEADTFRSSFKKSKTWAF